MIKLPTLPQDFGWKGPRKITRDELRARDIEVARVVLEAAAQYLEGVHETRLSKFADHIRSMEIKHD